jgi:hypothetical protein
LPGRS